MKRAPANGRGSLRVRRCASLAGGLILVLEEAAEHRGELIAADRLVGSEGAVFEALDDADGLQCRHGPSMSDLGRIDGVRRDGIEVELRDRKSNRLYSSH